MCSYISITGALIGWIARRLDSLLMGVVIGGVIGLVFATVISVMQKLSGQPPYYWQIMLPGAILGMIVGYATFTHRERKAA